MHGPVAGEYLAGHTSMVRRDPVGVIASIAPWNYPLMMAAWKLAPALAGGNTIVLKPSEQTPLTALKLAQHLAEVFPEGVANIVTGQGATVGSRLINDPRVAMISLTGDVGTGRKVIAAAQATLKRTHLELGGKAPVIVFDDADIGEVVAGLRSFGFYNAGQDCTAACRVYASDKVYDNLVADLSSAASSLVFDKQDDTQNEIGPLISARQQERVAGFVERAQATKHIKVTAGGKPGSERLLLPAHRRRRRDAGRRDRAPRSVRSGHLRHALQRRRAGGRVGERFRLRPRLLRLDEGCRPRDADRGAAALRLHLGELPLHADQRDAARRVEVLRLRQRPQHVRARGLHRSAPRHGEDGLRLTSEALRTTTDARHRHEALHRHYCRLPRTPLRSA